MTREDSLKSLDGLLTELGIERPIARFNVSRSSRKTVQGVRARLTDLHPNLHDLPPVLPAPRQLRIVSVTSGGAAYKNVPRCAWLLSGQDYAEGKDLNIHPIKPMQCGKNQPSTGQVKIWRTSSEK